MKKHSFATQLLIVALTLIIASAIQSPPASAAANAQSTNAAPLASPLPLGTLSLTSDVEPNCPSGHTCHGFVVTCSGLQQAHGFLAYRSPSGTKRGLVMFFSGGYGTSWWSGGQSDPAASFFQNLIQDGFMLVQVRWVDSWLTAAAGQDTGSSKLACRPATAVQWVYTNQYLPLGVQNQLGRCGFCITGNSGGSSQVSYTLSHYGLEGILNAVIPTSGPPHAAQRKGCLRNSGETAYWYDASASQTIDSSYGFSGTNGPCSLHDASWTSRWDAESVDISGNDYYHPNTRIQIILGGQDNTSAPAHAQDYAARLQAAHTPYFTLQTVPTMPHTIQQSADGLAALHTALLAIP